MTDNNIIPMPTALDRCAAKIRAALDRQDKSREAWIASSLDLCVGLAAARAEFPDNVGFGRWCEANGFGENVLNHQTRAAAVNMGNDLPALQAALAMTKRSSLETIYRMEFDSFTNVRKTPRKQKGVDMRRTPPAPKVQAALDAYDKLAGQGLDPTGQQVAKEAGVSVGTAARAVVQRQLEAQISKSPLPKDAQVEISRTVAAEKRRLEKEYADRVKKMEEDFRIRVHEEAEAWVFEHHFPSWARQIQDAARIRAAHRGLWTKQQYYLIVKCLHSDRRNAVSNADLDAAFRLVHEAEAVLRRQDAADPNHPKPMPLPKTLSEMLKMKKQVKEERAAQRKARAAARGKGTDLPVRA
jgi:hypothetical protein